MRPEPTIVPTGGNGTLRQSENLRRTASAKSKWQLPSYWVCLRDERRPILQLTLHFREIGFVPTFPGRSKITQRASPLKRSRSPNPPSSINPRTTLESGRRPPYARRPAAVEPKNPENV